MNILLMSMPDVSSGYSTTPIRTPHLGLASIAGNLDSRHTVAIADLILRRSRIGDAVIEALTEIRPDLVGLSAMTFQYPTALRVAALLKKENPNLSIALGGVHATLMYEDLVRDPEAQCFDFIFRGESEQSFNDAVEILSKGGELGTIKGLSYKRGGHWIHSPHCKPRPLSTIRAPNRGARLWKNGEILGKPFDLIEFSRGCPLSCSFCNVPGLYGRSFRTFAVDRVIDDIECCKKEGTEILFFTDENFTCEKDAFMSLCRAIIDRGHNDILYGIQASSQGIASSPELVKVMAEAGFKYVFLGIENSSEKNLFDLHKGNIIEQSARAVKLLKRHSILVAGGFIIGNPEDDAGSLEETYRFARRLDLDFYGMAFLIPNPKTPIRKRLIADGLLDTSLPLSLYNSAFPIARTKHLDLDKLMRLKYELNHRYLGPRPGHILRSLLKMNMLSRKALWSLFWKSRSLFFGFLLSSLRGKLMSRDKRFALYRRRLDKLNDFSQLT